MLYLIIYYYKCKLYFIFNTKTEIFFKNYINKIILIYKYVKLMIAGSWNYIDNFMIALIRKFNIRY